MNASEIMAEEETLKKLPRKNHRWSFGDRVICLHCGIRPSHRPTTKRGRAKGGSRHFHCPPSSLDLKIMETSETMIKAMSYGGSISPKRDFKGLLTLIRAL